MWRMTITEDASSVDQSGGNDEVWTAVRTCPLCEAGCGLELSIRGRGPDAEVVRIRGDRDDVFSHGFICPKGSTLKQLREDPDRLRSPLVKRDGQFVEVGWDEAFAEVDRLFSGVIERHGREALGAYVGNPNVHNLGPQLYLKVLLKSLGTPNLFSASTVDQRPKEISSSLLFGGGLSVPVPDIDRTDLLVLMGANPFASNGSLATAPDWPGRLEAIVARGGSVVVIDPRRTRTAEAATEHHFLRPGTDALLLLGIVHTLGAEGLIDCAAAAPYVTGIDEVVALAHPFSPEAVAGATGIDAGTIRDLARRLAGTERAALYGRLGTTTQIFGTATSWLVDVVNVLAGNLDRPGGVMFTRPAIGSATTRGKPREGRETRLGRRSSRVSNLPETMGELPVVCMAEEIDTPGPGQIRGMVCVAGNPVLSTPDSARLNAALAGLEAMVAVDIYLNETTRHADVILPVPDALAKGHYDLALLQLAIRNVANYSPPLLPLDAGQPDEWEVLARLAMVLSGQGDGDPAAVDQLAFDTLLNAAVTDEHGPVFGRDPAEIARLLEPRTGPERLLDLMVRVGPYGDGFGRTPRDWTHAVALPEGVEPLTLDVLLAHPHGIDLGALTPRLPEVLRTPSGMIDLAPEVMAAEVPRIRAHLATAAEAEMVLIGRRHLRSNNSWMHNVNVLVRGAPRCTLLVNPADATRLGLQDGRSATVASRVGKIAVPVEVTDTIMPGVVSLPHGWGHDSPGARLQVAAAHAGVNSNLLADPLRFDAVSGNAVLNGIPVEVSPA